MATCDPCSSSAGVKPRAFDDVEVLHVGHLPGVAADLRVRAGLRSADDLAGGVLHGAERLALVAVVHERAELVERDVLALAILDEVLVVRHQTGLLGDGEDVRAHLVDLGGDVQVTLH